MPALNIKYFDEGSGQWGMRRPATNQAARNSFSFLCLSVGSRGNGDDHAAKASALANLITAHNPTFIILNDVTLPFYTLLKENGTVRMSYGVTDFSANMCNMIVGGVCKPSEHTSCFLVAHYVPVPFAEHNIKSEFNSEYKSRPFAVMYIRGFMGLQFAIGALHFDPLHIVAMRANAIGKCLEKIDPAESQVALIFANFLESTSNALRTELPLVLDKMPNFNWSDVQKLQTEGAETVNQSSALWMRQSDASPVVVQSCVPIPRDEFTYCALTSFKAGSGESPGITIPQPRSAKVESKVSPSVPPTPMSVDPAVVSIDKSPNTLPQSVAQQRPPFPNQPPPARPSRRWFADRITHIRRPPDHDERDYDLMQFKTVDEAVRALNGTFQWSFDYMIVGTNLLYCEGAKPSYPAFKRYCSDHVGQMTQWRRDNNLPTGKAARLAQRQPAAPLDVGSDGPLAGNATLPPPNTLPPNVKVVDVLTASAPSVPPQLAHVGSTAPNSAFSPQPITASPGAAANLLAKQQQAAAAIHRQRVWSEHCATIIYQTTPLELRFDISSHVGHAKNNLATAVERLNSRNKKTDAAGKPDPLATYAYDYALLFNADRQAYWLIACTDAPCDIVACRNNAFRLSTN